MLIICEVNNLFKFFFCYHYPILNTCYRVGLYQAYVIPVYSYSYVTYNHFNELSPSINSHLVHGSINRGSFLIGSTSATAIVIHCFHRCK